jgi:Tol biopolymer transport system component
MKEGSSILRNAVLFTFALRLAFPSLAGSLQLVSAVDPSATPPASAGGDSWHPILTPDGRYVLFASRANNLVLSGANSPFLNQVPPKMNVFLRDRTNGTTTLVSVSFSGTGPGNGDSIPTALSPNGQFALFESTASDLVLGDTNNATDIFLRDLVHGTNQLVSVRTNGGCANGSSWESAMTPDGRYVAFASAATNLVMNDTNGIQDIFVRDTQAGVTLLASPDATASSSSRLDSPQITPDGRYVVFRSTASTLEFTNAYTVNEIYVRDLLLGTTTLASTNAHNLFAGTRSSYNHVISDDGQFVAFESSSGAAGVIQRYNLQTGFTDIICTNAVATFAYNHFRSVDMTPDGRFVTFVANTGTGGATSCVCVWDAQSGLTTLASAGLDGTVPTNSVCDWPTLDTSGRWVAFLCTAANLTTNVESDDFHLYVHDLLAGVTTLVDAGANGAGVAKDFLNAPRLTPDGSSIAFDCTDSDLVTNDNNQAYDVFVNNLTTGATELISVRQPALPSQTPPGATLGAVFSVSTDGRYIAFSGTGASLLATAYTNPYRGVFMRDQLNGTNVLASADTNGLGGADGSSFDPSISGDGRYVAFTSGADNLVMNDTNQAQDVFLRDLQAGITTLVSVNINGAGPGNAASYSPAISANGRYVLFHSKAKNLATGSFNGSENLFLRDLQLGATYAITTSTLGFSTNAMTPDLRFVAYGRAANSFVVWDSQTATAVYTNTTSTVVYAISPDGNRIAYSSGTGFAVVDRAAGVTNMIAARISGSHSRAQFSGDSRYLVFSSSNALAAIDKNGAADVYLYDFQTQSNLLISQSCISSSAANGPSDSPAITADGRFIAYRSSAGNLVPGPTNGLPNVFVFDRQTGATTLVSLSVFGDFAANNASLTPAFSGDSQTLLFQSWAADLVPQDFNQSPGLFALKLYTSIATPAFLGQIIFAPASGQNPALTWPAAAGRNYQVQFKNNLTDPVWQNLNGDVTIVGDRAFATDFAPSPSQRFYRIAAF